VPGEYIARSRQAPLSFSGKQILLASPDKWQENREHSQVAFSPNQLKEGAMSAGGIRWKSHFGFGPHPGGLR